MNYYERSDLEPYVGRELSYIAYVYPMGTSATGEGRYYDEYEEVQFTKITDRCVVVIHAFTTPEDKKFTDEILIPIEHIIAFRVANEVEPKK